MSEIQKIVTAAEMQAIEQRWFDSGEIRSDQLIDRVGKAVANWILDDLATLASDTRILVLVGKGNNGSDALVAARYLAGSVSNVTVALAMERPDDPILDALSNSGMNIVSLSGRTANRRLTHLCTDTDIVIDGVLGYSISRPIEEPLASMFQIVKESGKRVIAIDLPSGANPDTGQFDPNGLPAETCLTVGLHKLGPAVRFGDSCYGNQISVLDIEMPTRLTEFYKREVNNLELARTLLPSRDAVGHKGDFGRSLLVCGSNTYVGAASLAVRACVRSGVGLVALATPISAYQALAGSIPEATYIPLDEDGNGVLPGTAFQQIQNNIENMDSVLVGVGLSLSYGARALVSRLASTRDIWKGHTVVVDADGLTLVAEVSNWWEVFDGNLIITPHPGEMSRLLGISISEVEADRLTAVQTAAERFNCVVVLKGATTLIASPDGRLRVNMAPNHGLAKGGSGDVLAGLITGLCARIDPFDAASLGVFIHSHTGQSARDELTPFAMTASDLLTYLPNAFRALAS